MNHFYSFKKILFRYGILVSFTMCIVLFSGVSVAQGSENIPLKTLHELFQHIESQGIYKIFYQNNQVDVNRKITVNPHERNVNKLLTQALRGTGLSFKIVKNHIVIIKKNKKEEQQNSAKVKGHIVDNTGETLIGVSIVLKGTLTGTVTDINGNYELPVPSLNDTLIFSYIGYKKMIEPIRGRTQINITMKMTSFALNEVVAVGYGLKKKTDIIGAVAVVKAKQISSMPVANISEALQGKATGVSITQNTGAPGDATSIRIRGTGTINNNSPLFIIDGVPTKNADAIPPSDIQSISILKDAATASIYGSRASGGVILITTKKGGKGGIKLNFTTYTGIQKAGNLTKMCNKDQYIEIYNEAATNDGRSLITPAMADTLPNTNWWKEIFRPALISSTNLSASGGNKNMNYLVSGNYFHQEGIILNSGFERYSFRSSINSNLSKKVKIGTNINLSHSITDKVGDSGDGYGGNGGSVVRYAFFRTPIYPVYDKNGNYIDYYPKYAQYFGDGYNPVGFAEKYDWKIKDNRLLGNIYLHWKITDHLTFRTDYGLDFSDNASKRFDENWGYNLRINNPNTLTQQSVTSAQNTWKNTVTFNKTFKDSHHLNIMAGTEAIHSNLVGISASAQNFPDQIPNLRYLSNGTTNQRVNGWQSQWTLLSFFGRVSYNYKEKYYAQIVMREDGSSRFGSNYPWAFFPAAALGWRIDKEAFMSNIGFVSYLKLRASAGILGNQEIGDYSFASLITSGAYYPFGNNSLSGYYLSKQGNENLRWESQKQIDIGLDLGLFNNQLFFYFDYYNKLTSDVLVRAPLPPSSGSATPPYINAGKIRNNGMELEANYKNNIGRLKFNIGLVASHINNKVLALYQDSPIPAGRIDNGVYATLTEEGYPVGSFYLYEMEGVFQDQKDIFTHAFQGNNIKPGDVKYKDISGPKGVPDGIIDSYDRAHVGSPIPDFTMGINLQLNDKNWDFNFFVQGVYGDKIYWQAAQDIEGFYRAFNVTQRVYDDRWTGPGTSNTQPRVSWSGATNNKKPSTRFLFDGSYIRVKNVTLGYTFHRIGLRKKKIQSLRIYLSTQNLFTFTKYPGLDPEMQTSNNSIGEGDLAKNIDWGTYPMAKVYTLGFNMNF